MGFGEGICMYYRGFRTQYVGSGPSREADMEEITRQGHGPGNSRSRSRHPRVRPRWVDKPGARGISLGFASEGDAGRSVYGVACGFEEGAGRGCGEEVAREGAATRGEASCPEHGWLFDSIYLVCRGWGSWGWSW